MSEPRSFCIEFPESAEQYLATGTPDGTVIAVEIYARDLDVWTEIDLKDLPPASLRKLTLAFAIQLKLKSMEAV